MVLVDEEVCGCKKYPPKQRHIILVNSFETIYQDLSCTTVSRNCVTLIIDKGVGNDQLMTRYCDIQIRCKGDRQISVIPIDILVTILQIPYGRDE